MEEINKTDEAKNSEKAIVPYSKNPLSQKETIIISIIVGAALIFFIIYLFFPTIIFISIIGLTVLIERFLMGKRK